MNTVWSQVGFIAHPTMENFFIVPGNVVNAAQEACPSFLISVDGLYIIEEVFIEHVLDFIVASGRARDAGIPTEPYLVMEGDWGGQIYLSIPVRLIGQNANVSALLKLLDDFAWDCNEGAGKGAYVQESFVGAGVSGGMGGGEALAGLWVSEEFRTEQFTQQIRRLLDLDNLQKIDPGELFS